MSSVPVGRLGVTTRSNETALPAASARASTAPGAAGSGAVQHSTGSLAPGAKSEGPAPGRWTQVIGGETVESANSKLVGRPYLVAAAGTIKAFEAGKEEGLVIPGPPASKSEALKVQSRLGYPIRYLGIAASFGMSSNLKEMLGLERADPSKAMSRDEAQRLEDLLPKDRISIVLNGAGAHCGHSFVNLGTAQEDICNSSGRLMAKQGEVYGIEARANEESSKSLWSTLAYLPSRLRHLVSGTKYEGTGVEPIKYAESTQTRGFLRQAHYAVSIAPLDALLDHPSSNVQKIGRAANDAAVRALTEQVGKRYDYDLSLADDAMYCSELAVVAFAAIRKEVENHADKLGRLGASELLGEVRAMDIDTQPVKAAGGMLKNFVASPEYIGRSPYTTLIGGNPAGIADYKRVYETHVSLLEPLPKG